MTMVRPHKARANVLHSLRKRMESLRPSERKVGQYVLDNAADVTSMRIVDLSAKTEVSEPTVVRFCRTLGYSSFQQFKINLAQNLAVSPAFSQFQITDNDSSTTASLKIFDATINNLLTTRNALDMHSIDAAVLALQNATQVVLYGYGTSAAVAADAQHKLFRLLPSCTCYSDPHVQTMMSTNLGSEDVVIAISQSGRSKSLLHAVDVAKHNKVTIIAICPERTQLSEMADIHLEVDITNEFNMFTTMSSRVVQLCLLDVLVVNLAMRTGKIHRVLQRMQDSQRPLYMPDIPPAKK